MKQKIIGVLKFLFFLSIGLSILYFLYNKQSNDYIDTYNEKIELLQHESDSLSAIIAANPNTTSIRVSVDSIQKVIETEPKTFDTKIKNDFRGVNYFWILMVALAFMLSNVSRALRWNMLLRTLGKPVRFFNTFLAVMFSYLVNSLFPRAGEVLKCGVVSRNENIELEKVAGTAILDRVLDVLSLLVVVGLAFILQFNVLWSYLEENAGGDSASFLTSPLVIGAAIAGLVGCILLFLFRKKIQTLSLYKKIEKYLLGFWEGLQTIRQLDNPWLFVLHTVFIWLMYYLMLYLAFFSFEPTAHLSPLVALVAFVFGAFGIVIPSPGGIGSYQFLVMTALSVFYGVDKTDAFSFANIAFFAPFFCNIFFGFIAFVLLSFIKRKNDAISG